MLWKREIEYVANFRYKVRPAVYPRCRRRHRPSGPEEIAVDARGRAQGARYRAPDQALRVGLPGEPRRRQGLGAGVVVVLELGAESEPQVFLQRDLVLRKHVRPVHPLIAGQES